jgi:hypothetical protein
MATMCILVVEFLCQMMMGWLPVLKYLLSSARGFLWSCLVLPGIKSVGAYPMLKTLGRGSQKPEYVLSQGDEAGWTDRW